MADQKIGQCHLPRSTPIQYASEPAPEEYNPGDFEPPCPITSSSTFGVECFLIEEDVGVGVEIEAAECHDDVEEFVLHREEYLREAVVLHDAFVVGRPEGIEKGWGNGEEGEMLDIWVAVRRYEMILRGRLGNTYWVGWFVTTA